MRFYQAIFLSLLGHGIVLLPPAGQSPPEIAIAPMQITLNSTPPQTADNRQKQSKRDSRSQSDEKSHTDNTKQEPVADKRQSSRAVDSRPGQTNETDTGQHETVSVQTEKITRSVDDTPFIPTTSVVRDTLSQQQAQAHVVSRLHQALENYFEYPLLARRNGWEGRVVLALDVYLDGRIHNIQLKSGSGHRLLDRSALKAVSRIRTLPDVPRWRGSAPLNIDIPVIYRLQG